MTALLDWLANDDNLLLMLIFAGLVGLIFSWLLSVIVGSVIRSGEDD